MNVFASVVPRLLATGLGVLRENAIMPQLVNSSYSAQAGMQGSSIDIPIVADIPAQDVVPGPYSNNTPDITPTHISMPLDQWKEAAFYMTDKEMIEVMNGYVPLQAEAAVKSLCTLIDQDLFSTYKDVYGFVGTPGQVPFSVDTTPAIVSAARVVLNKQLAPMDPRYIVWSPDAEGNATNIRAFQDASWAASGSVIMNGQLQQKLGFSHLMDQNAPTHTAGTATSVTLTSSSAAGAKTVTLAAASGTLVYGDIITFAGHNQTYVVGGNVTLSSGGVPVTISPPLAIAVNGSSTPVAVAKMATHQIAGYAFQKNAIAFATRPLESQDYGPLGAVIQSAVDPITKLTLRLEVRREHRRLRWAYDILWGKKLVRPQFACVIAG